MHSRIAGTGGYLAADAFMLKGDSLTLMQSVSGLAKDADFIRALQTRLGARATTCAAADTGDQ